MSLKKQLDTPYEVSGTVMGQEVDSFAFNIQDSLIHIGYSKLDTVTTVLQTDIPHTLSGQEYTDFIARLNALAPGASQALVQACLEFLPGSGTIVNV